jgi:hypothetical protein
VPVKALVCRENRKHSASVMVWACFSGKKGRGVLYFLPKNCTMNGERYKQVLADHLILFMRIHKTAFLKQSQEEFSIIDWPGNSPDLNPIENCWSHMKRKLNGDRNFTLLPKLVEAIKMMSVQDMSLDYFQNLANSMPRRLQMVIDQKGKLLSIS